jgi:hypothetical protein
VPGLIGSGPVADGGDPMPAVYEIKFLPGGEILEFYGSRGDYYELADGTHVDVRSQPVWCRRCGKFTDGEEIELLEEIDQQIADIQDPTSELYRMTKDTFPTADGRPRFRPHFTDLLRQRRRWLSGRESPPKCLECGSTGIVVFRESERAENPCGPGWVEITVTGLCSTSFNNRFYTPEGDRIPRDTKPTYWSWPGENGGRPS